jgi:hypothetical protein
MPPSCATDSRSSLDGCEFLWKRSSSIVSWTLVKRLRVRRITLGLAAPSSETDQTLAVEDVHDSGERDMEYGGRKEVVYLRDSYIYITSYRLIPTKLSTRIHGAN